MEIRNAHQISWKHCGVAHVGQRNESASVKIQKSKSRVHRDKAKPKNG